MSGGRSVGVDGAGTASRAFVLGKLCLYICLALWAAGCSRTRSEPAGGSGGALAPEAEHALRGALSADRLGVAADAPIGEWLARLQENVRARPSLVLFRSDERMDAVARSEEMLEKGWVLGDMSPFR